MRNIANDLKAVHNISSCRTISSSNETISERRQALILKKALCTCPVQSQLATSSNESLAQRSKCVHLQDQQPVRNGKLSYADARCIITTHQKPLHIYSIIPFRKRTSSSTNKVKEKMDVRVAGGGRRLQVASRPMSSAGENQPFDPFNLVGIERRADGGQEVSYGYLLVPSKGSNGKNGVSWNVLICCHTFG